MYAYNIDAILGPGINIHRNPLNGRNFEYFSEDPILTGRIAAAICRGIAKTGATATIKHFCANNQERNRNNVDSVVSERALREVYLKPFEIIVKEKNCIAIMTAFNPVNGVWSCGNYDMTTEILRNEWSFDGFVMSDWWAKTEKDFVVWDRTAETPPRNFKPMVDAQNDIYMVHGNAGDFECNTILSDIKEGKIKRAVLQRNAKNICRYLMNSNAIERLNKIEFNNIEIVPENKVFEFSELLNGGEQIFNCENSGKYIFEVELASQGSELSQNTVVFYANNEYLISFTIQGANGNSSVYTGKIYLTNGECKLTAKYSKGTITVNRTTIYKV